MGNEAPPSSDSNGGSDDGIEAIDLKSALEERYLAYALSTIMGRALPDVRDGLKTRTQAHFCMRCENCGSIPTQHSRNARVSLVM